MPALVLGPMLRYVSSTEATVWVETDEACEVEVLGHRARTFCVGGHHYAVVVITGLGPDSATEYEVALDGMRHWPPPNSPFPPSRIQTLPEDGELLIAFGSCRVTAPHDPPFTLSPDEDEKGAGVDALYALALRLQGQDPREWPRLLLLMGDQVYADEVSPETARFIRARREVADGPSAEVLDGEEYRWLYREAWSQPTIRWLHSTIPSAMIFDDHDVHDDWNTSQAWIDDMRETSWWHKRIVAALSTYWVYQHLGNMSPAELEADELFRRVHEVPDATEVVAAFAEEADRDEGGRLWSFSRELGGARLIVLDSREGRVLSGGRREMIDGDEWSWVEEELSGGHDHVLVVSSLPVLLAPSIHYVEAWNEALCGGAWGRTVARLSEKLRRALDLEHWAAFQHSFHRLCHLVEELGSGRRGPAPASILLLGGDVHQGYVEEVGFRASRNVSSAVYQIVCSPFRNELARGQRAVVSFARRSRVFGWLVRRLAHAAGVTDPILHWRLLEEPTFANHLGWLRLRGRDATLTIETTRDGREPRLEVCVDRSLTGPRTAVR